MRLAFYAPLKDPAHAVPSGDRNVARGILAALARIRAKVDVASTLRTRDGEGNKELQTQLQAKSQTEITRIVAEGRKAGWHAWLTYHNYYKAPDLIGPTVAAALGIPYLQIESTRARKRLTGPWAAFAAISEAASDAADVIFSFTERDAETLRRDAPEGQRLIHLRPFLNSESLPQAGMGDGPMLAVGMMRAGDKLASYQIIRDTLALLPPGSWALDIAGDGPARREVDALMSRLTGKVRFLGALDAAGMTQAYAGASLMLWPGVNEAFGMVYLEAQAAGVPVVAQDRPGVREVLAPGTYPTPEDGPTALAAQLQWLLASSDARARAGTAARECVAARHLLPQAAATLRDGLAAVGVTP